MPNLIDSPDRQPILRVDDLRMHFGEVEVLRGISTSVSPGEVVAIIGPSGSGKSTFLRCLNQLETPTGGQVWLGDQQLTDPSTDVTWVRRQIGMVFQHFNLFQQLTVAENITFAPLELGLCSPLEARELAERLLRRVQLSDKADEPVSQLSGGQQQRVAIARALALDPAVMLFDEATSALDPELVAEAVLSIRQLAADGMTVLLVTHEMRVAREVADRVLFLADGQLVEQGTAAELFDRPREQRTRDFVAKMS